MVEKQCNFSLIKQGPQCVRACVCARYPSNSTLEMCSTHLITPLDDNCVSDRHLEQRLLLFGVGVKMSLRRAVAHLSLHSEVSDGNDGVTKHIFILRRRQLSALRIPFSISIAISAVLLKPSDKWLTAQPGRLVRFTEHGGHFAYSSSNVLFSADHLGAAALQLLWV